MKRFITSLIAIVAAFSLAAQNQAIITGSVKDADICKIYLTRIDSELLFIDSCQVVNGEFTMRTPVEKPDIYELYYNQGYTRVPIALEPGSNIGVVIADKESKPTIEVINGDEEKLLLRFDTNLEQYSSAFADMAADKEGVDLKKIMDRENKKLTDVIKQNPQTLGSIYTLGSMLGVEDAEFFNIYETAINTTNYRHSHYFRKIEEEYNTRKSRYLVGKQASDFEAKTLDGKPFSLSQLRGKYVLLNFWASWCAPCRKKNGEIAHHLSAQSDNSFVLVSFNVDDEKKAWQNASQKDNITWINVSNGSGFSNNTVLENYKVSRLPSIFLINPQGVVVKQNLEFEEMITPD